MSLLSILVLMFTIHRDFDEKSFGGGSDYGDFAEKSSHPKPSRVIEDFVFVFVLLSWPGLSGLVLVSLRLYFAIFLNE
jgi:hypothetical protein